LQESVDVFAVATQQKGLTLELVVGDTPAFELPSLVRVDARRLRQVLINLLGNAVKFTDAGGVTCVVADAPGERPPPGRRRLRFALRDSGIGIDAAEIPQLMTPFHQIGDLTSRNPGAGLGLAI